MISAKRASRLKTKKHREAERLFLAEGAAVIDESPGVPEKVFTEARDVRRVSSLQTPTGPVGVFPFLDVPSGELLASRDRVTLLHGVQDPGNVGTVIRAAHAFGAGVALSKGCADLYNPKTVRATMGSIFHAPVAREQESLDFLEQARSRGFEVVAAVPEGGVAPPKMQGFRLVFVVGSEGGGLPEEVLPACERAVTIPSEAASLNAAVAASILLYEGYYRVLP